MSTLSVKERNFDVLRRPVITEKSTNQSEFNKVTFKVDIDATKPEIKRAVEEIFGTKVKKVNTIKMDGKVKRFRGRLGKRADYKKAVVTLEEGQTIDMTAGV